MKTLFENTMKETGKVDYMIDISYGEKDWAMPAAIREVLANMLDTKTECSYTYHNEGGYCSIIDAGPGLPKKALVMGASSKSNTNNAIGQFGEGLKMAFVCALRFDRKFSIKTVNFGAEIEKFHSEEYDCDMMRVIYTDNACEIGTEVRIECSEEEFNQAVDMFLQFKTDFEELDKGIYLPGGYVSILGLTTEERPNMLFSYDLNDKSLTNRDRNVIKTRQLKSQMEEILSGMKAKKAVLTYLQGMVDAPESEEYKIAFTPRAKKTWLDIIKKEYGENVVFSSTSDGDVKAVYKGLRVIPCPTKQVRAVFTAIGLKSSAQKTKAVKTEKVALKDEKENKITYPIARNYVESWTIRDAGRELLANGLDVDPKTTISYDKDTGRCLIEDNGSGIERKHFVIGNSGKGENEIGVFGEGYKMAALVFARENRDLIIETKGYTYRPTLEMSKEFGTEIFSFYYEENKRKKGTKVSFKASEKEMESIKNLFISFNENIKVMCSEGKVDVIDDGESMVYVNGLAASSLGNSLFSYNIKDKELVDSRDRNHTDEAKLNMLLTDFFNNTSNTDVIDRILTGWQEDVYKKEYALTLNPTMGIIWYTEVDKCFPNTCVASMYNEKANFISSQAGYKLLKGIPPYILQVISHSLKTADDISNEIGDNGILFGDRILYPITSDYVPDWSVADGICELISNAMDASISNQLPVIEYKDGNIIIEDSGKGLKKENLLIGNSSSREVGTAIGTFGEGLKLALLSICRTSIKKVYVETVGFNIEAELKHDNDFNSDVLVMHLAANDRKIGTKIWFAGNEADLNTAKGKFLSLDPAVKEVEECEGMYRSNKTAIYANGVRIEYADAIFSYNLTSSYMKSQLSRDRKSFNNRSYVDSAVFTLFTQIKNEEVMKEILLALKNDSKLESNAIYNAHYLMNKSVANRWKKVALEVFKDCCLRSHSDEENLIAKDRNLKVLHDIPRGLEIFLETIGFPRSMDAVMMQSAKEQRQKAISLNELTAEERRKYDAMVKMVEKEYGSSMPKKIKIVACLDEKKGENLTLGMYDNTEDIVYMIRTLLSDNYRFSQLLGVIAHEFTHRMGKHKDRTREFENDLTDRIGELLEREYRCDIKGGK